MLFRSPTVSENFLPLSSISVTVPLLPLNLSDQLPASNCSLYLLRATFITKKSSVLCPVPDDDANVKCESSCPSSKERYCMYVALVGNLASSLTARETEPLPLICPYATAYCTSPFDAVLKIL